MSQTFPRSRGAPGQTPGAAPQGCNQPPQRPIPSFHACRLDRRAELPEPQLFEKAAWTTTDHASADLHNMARRNGPKDTDLTPVVPRYYSPGLPIFNSHYYLTYHYGSLRDPDPNSEAMGDTRSYGVAINGLLGL